IWVISRGASMSGLRLVSRLLRIAVTSLFFACRYVPAARTRPDFGLMTLVRNKRGGWSAGRRSYQSRTTIGGAARAKRARLPALHRDDFLVSGPRFRDLGRVAFHPRSRNSSLRS